MKIYKIKEDSYDTEKQKQNYFRGAPYLLRVGCPQGNGFCLHHHFDTDIEITIGHVEACERDINMIGQPGEQQIVGEDHLNDTTVSFSF